ncbi:hypothetical protein GCM10010423_16290 [Streptomyces levis]|uniref:Uncharacterized protein n=1 Tax=Streptomyces levis TaxID=285566 RepID=A0ABP6AVC5_9ACTN
MTLSATGVTSAMARRTRTASGDAAGAEAARPWDGAGAGRWAGTRDAAGGATVGAGGATAEAGGATAEAKGAGVNAVGRGPDDAAGAGDVGPGGGAVLSAGGWGGGVGRPTGRIAAGRRTSAGPGASAEPGSLPGSGLLRGVNQPPPPPEVPLSADVVVGASMVCLASSIFRSVCALPWSEGACFPPLDGPCSHPCRGQCGHIQPVIRRCTDK